MIIYDIPLHAPRTKFVRIHICVRHTIGGVMPMPYKPNTHRIIAVQNNSVSCRFPKICTHTFHT